MGIKGLWAVLSPYSEKKSLHEIRGETVAVDLSGWICDSQNVTEYYIQPKLYLRNLFFRTAYLVLADIKPIFVLEGDAPELKRDVMAARNAIQFRGAAPRVDTACGKKPDVARRRFKGVLKECESLLRCMGVSCVKGAGEAEATCAALNAQGFVDAVVSQDSDCFAYGAKRVYRNFSVSNSAGGGALQGSVDCYDATKMYDSNGFGRNKMVALAILCGCDYGVGACGSSVNTAVSFLHTVPESDVIPRLLSWVVDPQSYEEKSRWVSASGRCDRCGHVGRTHTKNGCPVCATHRGCEDLGHKAKVSEVKRELSLRSRAVSCGMPFPEPKVMKEFLNRPPDDIDMEKLKKPAPNLIQFVKLMTHKLDWSERYCVEKFLPILTKWHLQECVPSRTLKAAAIKKKRTPRGVPSFQVVWSDVDGLYEGLIPDDQFEENEDPMIVWTTTERQDLMRQFYPELVETFEEATKKPQKEKKPRKKKNEDPEIPTRKYNRKAKNVVDNVNKSANVKTPDLNTSKLNVSVSVNKLKRKIKNNKKGQKTIDSFVAHKKKKTEKKDIRSLRLSMKNLSLVTSNKSVVFDEFKYCDDLFDNVNLVESVESNEVNKENVDINNGLSFLEKTDDPVNDSDLSDIIDKIVSTAPATRTAKVDNNLVRLVFDKYSTPKKIGVRKSILGKINNNCSTPNDSPKAFRFSINNSIIGDGKSNNSIVGEVKANTSYFFDKLTEEGDAFEMSLHKSAVINLDSTVDYSLPDVCL